jgi:signal transduction histidine kinase
MTHTRATLLAVVAWLVALVAVGQAALLLGLTWTRDLPGDLFGGIGGVGFSVLALSCATTGAVIVARVAGNRVGPLFVVLGLLVAVSLVTYQYAAYAAVRDPTLTGAAGAAWFGSQISSAAAPLLGLVLLLFPDGRLPSPRWRPALVLTLTSIVVLTVGEAFAPGPLEDPFGQFDNPFGLAWADTLTEAMHVAGWALALIAVISGVCALAVRSRQAQPGERGQLRLVLRIGVPAATVVALDMIGWLVWNASAPRPGMAIIGVAFSVFAGAVGVAVVHLRLFDERRRIDGFVAEVLAGRADPEQIEPLLAGQLGDPTLRIGYVLLGEDGCVDRHGQPLTLTAPTHEVARAGERLALIGCAPSVAPDALATLAALGTPAIDVARLRIGERRRLDDLATARARIAQAGEAERRRIQRDLHDGAQARLISVGLLLRNLQPDTPALGAALDCAVDELAGAVRQLRDLSAGLPPSLLDAGLRPALADLAAAVPVAVRVEVTPERFSPGIESTAYFVACEGLANAIKHARASRVAFSVQRAADRLVIRVADDGVGGATAGPGGGLAGLRDRVATHGGLLDIDSVPAGGTVLTVELPCVS